MEKMSRQLGWCRKMTKNGWTAVELYMTYHAVSNCWRGRYASFLQFASDFLPLSQTSLSSAKFFPTLFPFLILSFPSIFCHMLIKKLTNKNRYIYNRKDEIIHGLSPSWQCVAPVLSDMTLGKVWNSGGGARPKLPLPSYVLESRTRKGF